MRIVSGRVSFSVGSVGEASITRAVSGTSPVTVFFKVSATVAGTGTSIGMGGDTGVSWARAGSISSPRPSTSPHRIRARRIRPPG
ncbi:hypothetical protein Q5H93_00155 [Hymenobacter sp. ASUV-10]|uniref:Uncharacterized protein n=1 Tax=Hymenobacter aranciens TaxID=3063996 RepID=A0ABT9B4C9_9BACT|nr:hypothetical protein [Hymenobacter sp. ASUV-10]MDO7873126.1 hypothetical protein [Hymenobacter sp. ASUV-10]